MEVNLAEKVVLITGSSRGIGAQLAKRCAFEGAKVIINYLEDKKGAANVSEWINEFGGESTVIKCDVTKNEDVVSLKRKIIDIYGKIDIVINNAGSCSDNLCPMMQYEQWQRIMSINLDSLFLVSRVFAKEMIKQGSGKIINIASLKGITGSRGQVNYSASKAGAIGFTKALAKELGDFNISVNAVCPGFIQTDMNKENSTKKVNAIRDSVLGIEDNLRDLEDFVVYMCSEKFRSISGQVFHIDSRI